jgi:hypothetical protein
MVLPRIRGWVRVGAAVGIGAGMGNDKGRYSGRGHWLGSSILGGEISTCTNYRYHVGYFE